MSWLVKNRALFFFIVLFLLTGSTYFLIQIARGYRFDPGLGELRPHGLLALKSKPDGAKIYINGKLGGATNTTLALTPGRYQIDVEKEGFNRWSKLLVLNKELVTQADIFLFPLIPNLQPLTYDDLLFPVLSPDGTKLAYLSVTNGTDYSLWVYELGTSFIDFNRSPRLIYDKINSLTTITDQLISWSPDNKWLIATADDTINYLINPNQSNTSSEVYLHSKNFSLFRQQWNKNWQAEKQNELGKLPITVSKFLSDNTSGLTFSPDRQKILYFATASASLMPDPVSPPVTASTQTESRQISPGNYYVYDIKELKNFRLPFLQAKPTSTPVNKVTINSKPAPIAIAKLFWLPSSNHLFWVESSNGRNGIWVSEYDGNNKTLIFSGSFNPAAVYTTTSMGKMVILSDSDEGIQNRYNLYTLDFTH